MILSIEYEIMITSYVPNYTCIYPVPFAVTCLAFRPNRAFSRLHEASLYIMHNRKSRSTATGFKYWQRLIQ